MHKPLSRSLSFIVLLLGLSLATVCGAADDGPDFDTQVKTWDRAIEKIVMRVQSGRTGTLEERELRSQLKTLADTAAGERDAALAQVKQIKGLLEALGPAPVEGGNGESYAIQKRRRDLGDQLAIHEGRVKQADLIIAKAEQTLSKITSRSRERLKDVLFERSVTPLSHKVWAIALPEAAQAFDATFVKPPGAWLTGVLNSADEQTALARNLFVALIAALASWALGRWLRFRYGRVKGVEQPSYSRRLLAGLVEGGGRSLAPVVFFILVGAQLLDNDFANGTWTTLVQAVVRSLVLFFLGYALINAELTPRRHEWRLLDFGEEASRLLVHRLRLILVVFLVFDGAHRAVSWATPSVELGSVSAFVFTLILVPLLISLLGARIWGQAPSAERAPAAAAMKSDAAMPKIPRVRAFLTVGLLALPVAAALGYPGLATYLMRVIVMSALVLAALGLLRSVGREGLSVVFDPTRPIGRGVRDSFALTQETSARVLFWFRVVLDLGLLVVAVLALLPVWGLGTEDTAASLGQLMRGVRIGSYTFSLIDILIGLALFAAIMFLTRLVQKGLERHILPNLTKDKGIRDALKTGAGYVGVVVALLVTVSALGLDLTNLALIAGALSVGIGFGLQNVVNNFVSGLILLAERPIKPGDWVVVGGHEGTVKKVNVRSTEVETFQRASVIIPNADLISSPVVNWTHKNILGRVEVAVGVAYGTDPHLMKELLLDCARAHPNVIANPEPYVLFTEFGDSSLNFEVRAYLSNVEKRLSTASDIHFSVHDALKEQGIEIPFPQRVLHFAAPPPENLSGAPPKDSPSEA